MRNRLCAYVHQSPLIQVIIFKFNISSVKAVKYILRPRHQQPYYRAPFLGNGIQYDLRRRAFQQHSLASCTQASHPVEFRSCMIEGRYAQKNIVSRYQMMFLLHLRRLEQTLVIVEYSLRESCCSGRKIYCCVIFILKPYQGRLA